MLLLSTDWTIICLQTLLTFYVRLTSADDLTTQAGAHVIYSYPGASPPQSLLDLTAQGKVGGVILFGENVNSNLPSTISKFQSAYLKSPGSSSTTPLLIMTDQEGGAVRRLPGGPTLSEKQIGQSSNPSSAATTAGQQAASALTSYKNNANLAPVLGVYRGAGDFLDKDGRSYSQSASVAATCGTAFIKSQQSAKIIATAKHFPGLGAAEASQNTDAGPVTIGLSLNTLRTVDEVPFQQAISAGAVKMVMPSWARYPALDSTYPAGISSKWIQGELRGRLGFTGVTVSDAIEAGGLQGFGDDGERSVLASIAGMDLILASGRDASQGGTIVNALVGAVGSGRISRSAFDAATQRILNLRRSLV
ncbi:MAG: hypothetical protein Q9190_002488 [Brigantiaea leucoxantha]